MGGKGKAVSTASEIEMKYQASLKHFDKEMMAFAGEFSRMAMFRVYGREVCAKRARLIRKRGDLAIFFKFTVTGKARYLWLPGLTIRA